LNEGVLGDEAGSGIIPENEQIEGRPQGNKASIHSHHGTVVVGGPEIEVMIACQASG